MLFRITISGTREQPSSHISRTSLSRSGVLGRWIILQSAVLCLPRMSRLAPAAQRFPCATCAWRCGPTSRRHPESSRKEGKDVREVRRRAWEAEYVLSRCREDVARHIVARACTASHPTPPRLRVIVATRIGRGESARRTCRHARRRAGGGGRTHQASALGLLAEVDEQRGHVAEGLGRILPAGWVGKGW